VQADRQHIGQENLRIALAGENPAQRLGDLAGDSDPVAT